MRVTLVADFAAADAFKHGQKLPVSHAAVHHEKHFCTSTIISNVGAVDRSIDLSPKSPNMMD